MALFYLIYRVYIIIITFIAFFSHYLLMRCFSIFKHSKSINYWAAVPFIKWGMFMLGMRVRVHGLDKLPQKTGYLVAVNHQSIVDIVTIMAHLPERVVFLAKQELLKIPILGWDIKNMGHYLINRHNPKIAKKQMQEVTEGVKSGETLLVFPEGTRSETFRLNELKRGTFITAIDAQRPVIPIYLGGAGPILPKRGLKCRPGVIDMYIGEPIDFHIGSDKHKRELTQLLLEATEKALLVFEKDYYQE